MTPTQTIANILLRINNTFGGGSTPAGDFFVSSSGTGTGTGTQGDPFTGQQLQNLIASGLPGIPQGSTIKFNRGEVFRYEYNWTAGNVFVDAYGSGALPKISGDTDISSGPWTLDSGNIYYTTLATEPKWVYVNDQQVPMAESAWVVITGRPSQTTLTAAQATLQALNTAQAIVGSYLVAKEWEFRPCIRVTATAYNGTTQITMNQQPNQTDATGADTNNPFKLLNRKSDITNAGDWVHDAAAQRLYIKTAGGAPTNVKISVRDYGFKFNSGVDNVSIKNLIFHHQFLEGVWGTNNDNFIVDGCTFTDIRTNGASFTGNGTNLTFQNNTVQYIGNNGLHIGGIIGATITLNTFSHIGDQVGVSIPVYSYFKSVGCAIHPRWDDTATIYTPSNLTITYNNISNCGYVGIVLVGTNSTVQYNKVDGFLLKWSDGGAYYMSGTYNVIYGHGSDTGNNIMSNNLALNGNNTTRSKEGYVSQGATVNGLQFDQNNHDCTVENNFVNNVLDSGICINPSNDHHTIRYNKVSGHGKSGYLFRTSNSGIFPNANRHTFTNNLTVCGGPNQISLIIEIIGPGTSYNPFSSGGSCDNNRYVQPYATNVVKTIFNVTTSYTLAAWQPIFSVDASSTADTGPYMIVGDAAKLAADLLIGTNWGSGSDTTLSTHADNYYLDEAGTHVTSATVTPYSGRILIRNWPPAGSILVDDTYTGGAGNLNAHTRDTGGTWTIDTGTYAINGSGECTCSVNGSYVQDTGSTSVIAETTGKVSATAGIVVVFRQISYTDKCFVRISINATTPSSSIVNINVNSTSIDSVNSNAFANATNTYYTLRVNAKGGTCGLFVDGVIRLDVVNNATLAAENPSTTRHGVNQVTTGTQTRTTIYNTSF